MANVDLEPAGKAALENLGVWPSVADRIVQAKNVRAALALVANGRAPLGIVYQTDANSEPKVKVVRVSYRQPPCDSLPCGDRRLIEEPGCENVPQLPEALTGPRPSMRSTALPFRRRVE